MYGCTDPMLLAKPNNEDKKKKQKTKNIRLVWTLGNRVVKVCWLGLGLVVSQLVYVLSPLPIDHKVIKEIKGWFPYDRRRSRISDRRSQTIAKRAVCI